MRIEIPGTFTVTVDVTHDQQMPMGYSDIVRIDVVLNLGDHEVKRWIITDPGVLEAAYYNDDFQFTAEAFVAGQFRTLLESDKEKGGG